MKQKVGFIGLGVMGQSMAKHILQAGYSLSVYTRTKEKAEDLIKLGAVWMDSISGLANECEIIITMIGYPKDVEEVYLGENGIVSSAKPGTYVIDMTTSQPSLAKKIYEQAKLKDIYSLDAPVSGGDIGAREARLAIMVGGDKEAFDICLPLFEKMGQNIVYQGEAGSGQHTKMCNQIAIASGMIGVCEAISYAKKSGLEPENVLKSIQTGAAGSWSLSNLAPRMLADDFEPGFFIKHFIKDMGIALDESNTMNLYTPGLELANQLYEKLAEAGFEDKGTQALVKLWEEI
ncbi:NAD(P)-dependent oxidoreductase [Metabacillus halosaccharovorans]|uniref:NAD(P)-dependent oxidoreductase n=1 Tax=Metabacillus halosaccharovorans TaxID=930124 RepID=A0ABT3DKJ3_9BACI|nr:NAD(P)-dependent oxidoreductase [Metabacillus halosaccharovorans]MCV9887416.1 NAD(P)-dependent oxidoreductase [Metabacillus halosaccharovorans]